MVHSNGISTILCQRKAEYPAKLIDSNLRIRYTLNQRSPFILKEDETPTSIGGELQRFSLGGSPISFQDKASGGSQAWSVEECFAFDHAAARTPEAFLKTGKILQISEEMTGQNKR